MPIFVQNHRMMKIRTIFAGAALLIATISSAAPKYSVDEKLAPLPAGSITLTDYLQDDILNSLEHWNKSDDLPYKAFVEFFRTGRAKFALGEMWGKAVRSGSLLYRYTHDEELKAIMKETMEDMLTTQRSNGSFCCVPPEKQPDNKGGDFWERKYVLLGMLEYYTQIEQDPRVLKAMKEHADCILDQIGHAPKTELLTLGWSSNNIESATILEPMMWLYRVTGEQRYLDFSKYVVETGGAKGYDLIQQACDNVPPHKMGGTYPKAYEMLSFWEGLADYYRVTGDERVRKACFNLYENVRKDEITIIGNGGADQPYHPKVMGEAWDNTALEQTNPDIKRSMETCVGVTWMKYCYKLLCLTGDASIAENIEKYVYNGLLGAMKPEGDGFSYVNRLNGEKVTNSGWGWNFSGKQVTCCNLNGPIGLAFVPLIAVMQRSDGPVVNLYNACRATASTPSGRAVELVIDTQYPRDGHISITVNPESREKFSVGLRIPEWCRDYKIKAKGCKKSAEGNYLTLTRKWKKGDRIEIDFTMECVYIPAPHGSNRAGDSFQALKWGPLVLARDENIDKDYDKPVTFEVKDGIVDVKRTAPTRPGTRMEFIVPTADGGSIRMVDFSSVDCWKGSHICTWMPL